jgi:hypothetical protein
MQLNSKEDSEIWRKREVSLYIMLANFLLEIKDFPLTISIMTKIVNTFSNGDAEPDVISALGRLYLQASSFHSLQRIRELCDAYQFGSFSLAIFRMQRKCSKG